MAVCSKCNGFVKVCQSCMGIGSIPNPSEEVTINRPQPKPIPNNQPAVWDLVIQDIKDRDRIGEEKYKTRLQPNNGRNFLKDAYEEALDLSVYLRGAIYEIEKMKKEISELNREISELKQKGN